jgi:6-phosphogluconolactonase
VAEAKNASFLAIHPNEKWIYAINEISDQGGKPGGGVTGYVIEKSGKLKEINQESSVGAGPAHLAIDPSGKWLLVVNYGGGSSALLPIGADGKLGKATSFVEHEAVKPQVSHAHCANFSPDGKFAFVCDAGVDKIHQFKVDGSAGKLVDNNPAFVRIGPGNGTGPRHLAFSVDGKHAYVINETNLTMTTLKYDAAKGVFTVVQTVPTVPKGTPTKGNSTAEVVAHPSGKFLYGSNRGYDSIVTFAIDPKTAELTEIAQMREGIKVPRNFNVDPTGQFLVSGNQDGGSLVVFRIDSKTGRLTPTGEPTKLGQPVCVVFLAPK